MLNVHCTFRIRICYRHFLCQLKYWNIYCNGVEKHSRKHLVLLVLQSDLGVYYRVILHTFFDWDSGVSSLLSPSLSAWSLPPVLPPGLVTFWDQGHHSWVLPSVDTMLPWKQLGNEERCFVLMEAISQHSAMLKVFMSLWEADLKKSRWK